MILLDQLHREIYTEKIPNRIISIVPSITELLFDLGLREEVVGITKFCVHPKIWFRNKIRVGGTKKINLDLIKSLSTDLVIANKEENTQSDIDALLKFTTVYISDIKTIDDAFKMISDVGKITNKKIAAEKLIVEIKAEYQKTEIRQNQLLTKKALYFIWREPYMIAGGDTFISDMMKYAGFENAAMQLSRYPSVSIDEIEQLNPSILLLSSEPFPFKEKQLNEMFKLFPNKKIILVDGELFSWYGSRMKLSTAYFRTLQQQLENNF